MDVKETPFKQLGSLEATKRIEPLPPTEISDGARERLESWGLDEETINDLRNFTSQFRYDLCREKLERLLEQPFKTYSTMEGETLTDYVRIPYFFDASDRMDGQCADIARQWFIKLYESGLFKKINSKTRYGIYMRPNICSGQAKTHFNKKDSNHWWNSLFALNFYTKENGSSVYFDAAFQKIMTEEESGYTPQIVLRDPSTIIYPRDIKLKMSKIISDNNGHLSIDRENGGTPAVLGVSPDFKHAYSLGFYRIGDRVKPFLGCTHEDGQIDFSIETPPSSDFPDPEKLLDVIENIRLETITLSDPSDPYDKITWKRPN